MNTRAELASLHNLLVQPEYALVMERTAFTAWRFIHQQEKIDKLERELRGKPASRPGSADPRAGSRPGSATGSRPNSATGSRPGSTDPRWTLEDAQVQLVGKTKELRYAEEHIEALSKDLVGKQSTMDLLEQRLEVQEAALEKLQAENVSLDESTTREIVALQEKVKQYEEDLFRAKTVSLQEREDHAEQVSRLTEAVQALSAENEAFKFQSKELEQDLTKCSHSLAQKQLECEALTEQLEQEQTRAQSRRDKAAQSLKDKTELSLEDSINLEAPVEHIEELVEKMAAQVEQGQQTIQAQRQELEAARVDAEESARRKEELQAKLADALAR
eukprot:3867664-Rhodomonas_salina.4